MKLQFHLDLLQTLLEAKWIFIPLPLFSSNLYWKHLQSSGKTSKKDMTSMMSKSNIWNGHELVGCSWERATIYA